jgi:hypothetical protein
MMSVTSPPKCVGYYLRSLVITAIMTFLIPLVLLGGILLLLTALQTLFPRIGAIHHLQGFLTILGSGSPRQGVLLVGTVSSLVGMLFDTYAFYRYQGLTHRWFH